MTVCGTEEYALSDKTCLYNQLFLPPGLCVGFVDNNKDIEYHLIFVSFNSVENPFAHAHCSILRVALIWMYKLL